MAKSKKADQNMFVLTSAQVVKLDDEAFERLYSWVDEIPLSRPKKNITRDFSDGVMAAEVLHFFCPRLVQLHNYTPASGTKQKETNWHILNRKVLQKINMEISADVIRSLALCKPLAIENVLLVLRDKIDVYLAHQRAPRREPEQENDNPEADQHHHDRRQGYTPTLMEGGSPVRQLNRSHQQQPAVSGPPPRMTTEALSRSGKEMVPRSVLSQKEAELAQKEETVQILQAKVQRLEHLLHLRDIRIEDLSGKVENLEENQNAKASRVAKQRIR